MDFFAKSIEVLQTLVIALGGGLCVWGGINLLEGYGQDNPGLQCLAGSSTNKRADSHPNIP